MEANRWRPVREEASAATSDGNSADWRVQLDPRARQRVVEQIMEALEMPMLVSEPEDLYGLQKIALEFEEKIYTSAANQDDYVRKISLKMVSIKNKPQHSTSINPSMSNRTVTNQNSTDPDLSQPNVSGVSQTSNLQNMALISQNSANNSLGQAAVPDILTDTEGRMQGWQQQQHLSQNRYLYQHQTTQLQYSQQPSMQMASCFQSGQSAIQLTQPGAIQSAVQPGLQQNQQNSVQQPVLPLLQQYPQSDARQQQQPQRTMQQQQHPTSAFQQSNLAMHQHQHSNVQQTHLLGKQASVTEMQQQPQRMAVPQNYHFSMQWVQHLLNQQNFLLDQQQQLGTQSNYNYSGLQQQQQIHGSVYNVSNVQPQQCPMHMPQPPSAMPQTQGQQHEHQSSQQQLLSQFKSQPVPLQQPLVKQHSSSLQPATQQRVQVSGTPSFTTQAGHIDDVDWKEEIYQKIKSMKELYFAELSELYQKIAMKFQQHEVLMSFAKTSELFEKRKRFKIILEHILQVLQFSKSNIDPDLKDKIPLYEKQIINILALNKINVAPSRSPGQQQFQHPGGHSQFMPHQSQVPGQHDNRTKQQINLQGLTTSMQPAAVPGLQHGSILLSDAGVTTAQQKITSALQTDSMVETVQGSSFRSLQQGAIASTQQGGLISGQSFVNVPQQTTANAMSDGLIEQYHANTKQPSSSATQQQQHFKQQEQQQKQHHLNHNHQLEQQLRQHQLPQLFQKQRLLQQQQLQHQQQQKNQPQAPQTPVHQVPQLNQTNEVNELKLGQGPDIKPGLYPHHYSTSQHPSYYQQIKSGAAFPFSFPQDFQASSPQISCHSPQSDQQSLLPSQIKSGTPLQLAESPFIPSPSTSITLSPVPANEKQLSGVMSLPNAGNIEHQQATVAPSEAQSFTVTTPGITASPLLAEFTSPDGNQNDIPNLVVGKASTTEKPLERLIEVIRSSTPTTLSSAVNDIRSVVSMTDRIPGSETENGSRAAVGENLITKKRNRDTSAMPLNNLSSAGSVNDRDKQTYTVDTSELQLTVTSRVKRQKVETNHALHEEIREINQRLIGTEIKISDVDTDPISAASNGKGTIVKFFFTPLIRSPISKSSYTMSRIQPLNLLVPASYPKCSPVLLDELPDEQRESEDLSIKARSRFNNSLRGLSQLVSLGELARTWDACAHKVLVEYAQQTGGGTFSSTYGTWEKCVGV
ncbi:mediator of RNA polymerase II transcription subunit 15a-like isoform X2 [Musa acuminata AAA Group]|uniref:mediator of RNA polymerase II transcription subunit 15a-like isoform X2 n=1 Tax=Musa acuminata AAA Group TaxID=214697 RepID=UPI0031DDEF75